MMDGVVESQADKRLGRLAGWKEGGRRLPKGGFWPRSLGPSAAVHWPAVTAGPGVNLYVGGQAVSEEDKNKHLGADLAGEGVAEASSFRARNGVMWGQAVCRVVTGADRQSMH